MIRGVEFYFLLWIVVSIGIILFRNLSGREKWRIAKIIVFGALTAAIALILIVLIVFLF